MNYRLEIRVPISPTPDFFRRIHFMAASLRRLEGTIGPYVLVVCVGGDEEPSDLYAAHPWSRIYPLIWHWADRARFQRDSFWETSREIFRQPTRGRFVICADADVLFMGDFSDLLHDLEREPAVAGVIAHAPPFQDDQFAANWRQLFADYETPPPSFEFRAHRLGIYGATGSASPDACLLQLRDGRRVRRNDGNSQFGNGKGR